MRKLILGILFTILILLGKVEVYSQTFLPKENSCQPSAEEILSVIKNAYNLSPVSDGVLIAGEIRTGHILTSKVELSLFQAIAIVGGVLKTAKQPVYLIRQAADDKTKIRLEIDLRDIKQGRAKDRMLEKGDTVFVLRGCVDGKLLPPKGPIYLRRPAGTDYPINTPNKRVTK